MSYKQDRTGNWWPIYLETGTTHLADHVTCDSGWLNLILHHSILVYKCWSSSRELISMEHTHRNGNVHHRTSHMTMMMTIL